MNGTEKILRGAGWALLLAVCISGLFGSVTAGEFLSEKKMDITYSLATYTDIFVIEEANDGGFLIGGHAYRSDREEQAFLFKADSEGNRIWSDTYKGKRIVALHELEDGRIIVASVDEWVNPDSPTAAMTGAGYLMMLDQNGDLIWNKKLVGDAPATIIVQDEEILLAGWTWSPADDPEGISGFLTSYSPDGELLDVTTYDGVSIHDMLKTDDGGFLLVGNTGDPVETINVRYGHLTKIDSSGEIQWREIFDERSLFAITRMDNGYLIVGGTHPYGYSEGEAWALGVSEDGDLIWEEKLQGYATYGIAPFGEHFLVAGATGPSNPFIAILGSNGTVIESERMLDNDGRFTAVTTLSGNRVAVGGWSRHTGDVEGWLLVFKPDEEPEPTESPGFGILAAAFGTLAAAAIICKRKRD